MARKPRIHYPGALYHVMLRGNAGQKIFFDVKDREVFNDLIEEGVSRYGHVIYAYCWMGNHIHLAIEVGQEPLSKIIQNVSFRYTRHINKKLKRVGHLFQGRYKALLVEKQSYLLELIRYIHLNPVRAKLVTNPEDYPWSGHRGYLGTEEVPWLEFLKPLSMFSKQKGTAIKKYTEFIQGGINDKGVKFEKGEKDARIIGDEYFVKEVTGEMEDDKEIFNLDLIIDMTCKFLSINKKILSLRTKNHEIVFARYLIAYLNKYYGTTPSNNLAFILKLDSSALCKGIRKIEIEAEPAVFRKIKNILQHCRSSKSQA